MKKMNQILLLCLFVAFAFSCKKDGESGVVGPSLVGKYKDGGTKGSLTIEFQGKIETAPLDEPATNEIIEFKSDGTVTSFNAIDGTAEFNKYKISGSQLILTGTENGKSFDWAFNYNLNGSTLTLTMDKAQFGKNLVAYSATGGDNEILDFNEFLPYFTKFNYTTTLLKQ